MSAFAATPDAASFYSSSAICDLQNLQEQQKRWTIPDTLLQSNMKDAIAEDFLPAYKVSKETK